MGNLGYYDDPCADGCMGPCEIEFRNKITNETIYLPLCGNGDICNFRGAITVPEDFQENWEEV